MSKYVVLEARLREFSLAEGYGSVCVVFCLAGVQEKKARRYG